jgi:hypothetical protein
MISLLLSWRATLPANDDRTTIYSDAKVSPGTGPNRRRAERRCERFEAVEKDRGC